MIESIDDFDLLNQQNNHRETAWVKVVGTERIKGSVTAHVDSAELLAGNWIAIRGWLVGAARGTLEARSWATRSFIGLEERVDVCDGLKIAPEYAFGFVCHLINADTFAEYPLPAEL